jgi:hypothetical protein
MMVAFSQNHQEDNDQINLMTQNQNQINCQNQINKMKESHHQQQKEFEEQCALLAAQEELKREALKAKDSLLAKITSA